MSPLHFELRPSLLKLGLSVAMFVIFSILLSNYLTGFSMAIAMLLLLPFMYFMRDKNQVLAFAQLDRDIWTIEFKDNTRLEVDLLNIHNFGACALFHFKDTQHNKSYNICVTKDQFDLSDWQKLQTLTKLF